ncbi:MAG: putative glycosyltransferase EpsJ [Pelotomaculum sp. PtaB.Bin104]|nr:MAG: putative glycosyltransferase EpsJ [Pelotomaculum sp. PtaB.Bin104]
MVSVIINNYNYGQFLKEAIDSALNQTYSNIEVIVVDDGSTDNSREIIAAYEERIIPVLQNNGGQASALNAGFAASKGGLICLLDSDDTWLESKVNVIVEAAKKNPEAVLIYHRLQRIDANGILWGKPHPSYLYKGWINTKVMHSGGHWRFAPTSCLCFQRALLERVMDIPEEEFRICADSYLADITPFLGPVIGIEEPLTLYKLHHKNNWFREDLNQDKELFLKNIQFCEIRVRVLNQTLERLGMVERVSLNDHLTYQYFKRRVGQGKSILKLSLLALRCPVEPSLSIRLKTVVKLWLMELGVIR